MEISDFNGETIPVSGMQYDLAAEDFFKAKAILYVPGVRNSDILSRTSWYQSPTQDD